MTRALTGLRFPACGRSQRLGSTQHPVPSPQPSNSLDLCSARLAWSSVMHPQHYAGAAAGGQSVLGLSAQSARDEQREAPEFSSLAFKGSSTSTRGHHSELSTQASNCRSFLIKPFCPDHSSTFEDKHYFDRSERAATCCASGSSTGSTDTARPRSTRLSRARGRTTLPSPSRVREIGRR